MRAITILSAVGLSLSLAGVSAVAQPSQDAPGRDGTPRLQQHHHPEGGPGEGRLFERLDTNEDGALSDEEVEAAKAQREAHRAERAQEMASRALERFDANEDGALDADELAEMLAHAPRHGRGHHPGQGHRGQRGEGGPRGQHAGPRGDITNLLSPEVAQQFDTDGDGKISREEAKASGQELRAALKEARDAKKAEMLQRFDLDGDGELSEGERDTLRQTVRTERRTKGADLDGDGALSAQELKNALDMIERGSEKADFNGDGNVDADDYNTLIQSVPGA